MSASSLKSCRIFLLIGESSSSGTFVQAAPRENINLSVCFHLFSASKCSAEPPTVHCRAEMNAAVQFTSASSRASPVVVNDSCTVDFTRATHEAPEPCVVSLLEPVKIDKVAKSEGDNDKLHVNTKARLDVKFARLRNCEHVTSSV